MDEVRVLIVADDPLARSGLAALLAGQPECAVVGQVDRASDLDDQLAVYRPDVLLWDLGWDPSAGPSASLRAGPSDSVRAGPSDLAEVELADLSDVGDSQLPVVALVPDDTHAAGVWTAGVRGLLLRDAGTEALVAALLAVAQGLVVLDPGLAAAVLPSRDEPSESLVEELTPRELEVLQLLAEGLPNKTIAVRLGISEHTVKFHVNAVLGKLGAQSRTDAVVRATRLGLIIL